MVSPEDILAARYLRSRRPQLEEVIRERLEGLKGSQGNRDLLSDLARRSVVTPAQARHVHDHVERTKRDREAQLYIELLAREGIAPLADLQGLVTGTQSDTREMERRLLVSGKLDPRRSRDLERAQAQLEQELAALLQSSGFGASPPPTTPAPEPKIARTVLLDPKIKERLLEDVSHDDSGKFTQAALKAITISESGLGVGFPIPDWVDEQDARKGEEVGSFHILGRVGAGAMGTVYLAAQDGFPERAVALKLLPLDAGEDAKGRFQREILANSFFCHPGALDIYDAGESAQGERFLAMEFFDGQDLRKVLDAKGRLEPLLVARIAAQVLETLGAAHQSGIVHRDLKPDNILLSSDGQQARLMDFGIAVIRDLGEFQAQVFATMGAGTVTGTPQYVSPEQAAGMQLEPPSDLYSLGCVLFELLSGRLPHESETPQGYITLHMIEDAPPIRDVAPDLASSAPAALLDLVDELMQGEPDDRPTVEQALTVLRGLG